MLCSLLLTGVDMTRTEFDLLTTLTRVYDHARSHFVFEICEPPTKRFLNALRIREEEDGGRMPWFLYKTALLERMQNSSTIDGLISYILKPRDNNCPIGLWVVERIAERRLLNDDGIEMSEDTWLELLLAFVTNEEKQTLQVPAREQRAAVDGGAGYTVMSLQRALTRYDPATFRKFQQGHCHDPVAARVLALHKLVMAEKAGTQPRGKTKAELEPHAAGKDKADLESHAAGKSSAPPPPRKTKPNEKFDRRSALPVKEGKPDEALYASFPEKSLRRRLWDAVVSGKCTRCNGPHLRNACPKSRQGWENDFEKDNFFSKPPPEMKKQLRVQLSGNARNLPAPEILSVMSPLGRCLIDTCSDVSVARRDVPIGTLELGRSDRTPPVHISDVYVVEPEMLPAGVVALLGVADIQALGISLDAVLSSPGCSWEEAVRSSLAQRVRRGFRRCFGFGPPPERRVPLRRGELASRVREMAPAPPARCAQTPIAEADLEGTRPSRGDSGSCWRADASAHCQPSCRIVSRGNGPQGGPSGPEGRRHPPFSCIIVCPRPTRPLDLASEAHEILRREKGPKDRDLPHLGGVRATNKRGEQ